MIDGSEITETAILGPFAIDATVNSETLRVIPDLGGEDILNGDQVEHTGPVALALESDVEALETTLTTGDAGDIITILGRTFRILSIDPDEMGGSILSLEET